MKIFNLSRMVDEKQNAKFSQYEICRKVDYEEFNNKGKKFLLSTYPYLDIVLNDYCNAQCKFCISQLVHKKEICNINKHKQKIKYAIEHMGVKEVLLVGGEPTIYDGLFEIIEYLKQFNLNKICITTNGHRMSKDMDYCKKLMSSGITHMNISVMSLDEDKQKYVSGSNTYLSLEHLKTFKKIADEGNVSIRINNNCFKGNNDNLNDILCFYNQIKDYCDSIKFSPLLKTDTFSTINAVTEFNREHVLSNEDYDCLWHTVENYFSSYPIIRNKETLGFVEYSMLLLSTPIIFNYNQHGMAREKIKKENKINNLKILVNSELSLSWNREEIEYYINTDFDHINVQQAI
ncbi:MAG: moaA [Clostridiaceae bacterium]|jgi:pyruvate-formate lyase-activating enzyme|nr:moaA [Clostridiaceae bacterium]